MIAVLPRLSCKYALAPFLTVTRATKNATDRLKLDIKKTNLFVMLGFVLLGE